MGTRYNITHHDIIVKMGREIEHDSTTGLRHVVGGIAGWDFSSFGGHTFSGPNVFKPELDEIFEEYGVKPEYY